MQQKELKSEVKEQNLHGVTSIDKGDHHVLRIAFVNNEPDVTIRTARGGIRKFKTLEAVKAMLSDVGVHNWLVR